MIVQTNQDRYFQQAARLLRGIPPFSSLRNKELELLAELWYFSNFMHMYTDTAVELLDPLIRDEITRRMNVSPDVFRNLLSGLRKAGILVDNRLETRYTLTYLQPIHFDFHEIE